MRRRAFIFGGVAIAGTAMTGIATKASSKESVYPELTKAKIVDQGPEPKTKKLKKAKFTWHKSCKVKMSAYDKAILVKTIWGEARGESRIGRMAIVHVILNRIHSDDPQFKSYKTISEVCLRKFQFSCWLDKLKMKFIKTDKVYNQIKIDVDDAIKAYEHGVDYSCGAVYYYSDKMDKIPKWAGSFKMVNKIKHHRFFG